MQVSLLSSPFPPKRNQLGSHLESMLRGGEGHFDELICAVAFVRRAGVEHLKAPLRVFRAAGGKVVFSVGVDHHGTTEAGLRLLYGLVDELFVFHDPSLARTFHPKMYLFLEEAERAVAFIGSGNTTSGGLWTNYEAHLRIDLNLTAQAPVEDIELFRAFEAVLRRYREESSPTVVKIDNETLERLLYSGLLSESHESSEVREAPSALEEGEGKEDLFSFRSDLLNAPPQPGAAFSDQPTERTAGGAAAPAARPAWSVGPGFFKVLARNDVSETSSPGQIVIPRKFQDRFPDLTLTRGPVPQGGGRQWEATFPVIFRDGTYSRVAQNARFIVYEPAADHPRPNTECRFTFHNREIFLRLNPGDMLIFAPASVLEAAFEIRRVEPGDPEYERLRSSGRYGNLY